MPRFASLLSSAALALGVTAIPSTAHAVVTVDCSTGPVAITDSTEDYVLTGDCGEVDVDASNVTIKLAGATRMSISGANVTVTSTGPIETLTLTEAVSQVTAPRATTATVRSSNVTLRIAALDAVVLKGANNTVRADQGDSAKVRGSNNRLTYNRLAELKIRGANNKAVVRKGRTSVAVHGPNNVVRVHRRA